MWTMWLFPFFLVCFGMVFKKGRGWKEFLHFALTYSLVLALGLEIGFVYGYIAPPPDLIPMVLFFTPPVLAVISSMSFCLLGGYIRDCISNRRSRSLIKRGMETKGGL